MRVKTLFTAAVFSLMLTACGANSGVQPETVGTSVAETEEVQSESPEPNPQAVENVEEVENNEETPTPEASPEPVEVIPMTKLLYQGHASFRITTKDGVVIYVDPYAGEGYDTPADIILVTHKHSDHNDIELVTQKDECTVITQAEALEGGEHKTFSINGVEIEAVEANNSNHSRLFSVGYIITVDGVKLYMAGDTSKTEQMATFAERELDYAFLPIDGVYNMDAVEAAECAELIGAKNNVPIHMSPGKLFNREIAETFDAPNRLIIEAGEEIELS